MSEQRSLDELAAEITAAAVRMAAATAAWLRLIAEFDEREGWAGVGVLSCAHWLAWQCGLSPGAAREHVRVARALRSLPRIAAAFDQGRLSYSKVRAVTRVAEADTEADLLEFALEATASQTERTVRQWRRADRVDAETIVRKRQFDFWWDDDGMLVLRARLDSEEGAALLAAVESIAERDARRERAAAKRSAVAENQEAGRPAGASEPAEGSEPARASGPAEASEPARASGPADAIEPGDGDGLGDPGEHDRCPVDDEVERARDRSTARRCAALAQLASAAAVLGRRPGDPPRREVVVHVDAALIADDAAAGRAYLEGGPSLHPADVRRMLCEATVITMLESGREVLAVGRKRRLATRAQRRALLRRDGGCARPGCPETRIERLHAHHLRPWLFGGRTDLGNLVLLCDADHGWVHDLDVSMARCDGRLIVTMPDGRRVWGPADAAFAAGISGSTATRDDVPGRDPVDAGADPATLDAARARRFARTPGPVSAQLFPDGEPDLPEAMHVNGERIDLAYVVGVLLGNRDVVRRLAAESGAAAA